MILQLERFLYEDWEQNALIASKTELFMQLPEWNETDAFATTDFKSMPLM